MTTAARLEPKQRLGLLIAVMCTTGVVVLAIALRSFVILAILGILPLILLPFRRQKAS